MKRVAYAITFQCGVLQPNIVNQMLKLEQAIAKITVFTIFRLCQLQHIKLL